MCGLFSTTKHTKILDALEFKEKFTGTKVAC